MEMSYIVQKKKKSRQRNRFISCLVWLIVISGCFGHAVAQSRSNQSDWNVPPPLTPGTINKGNIPQNNGAAGKSVVLTLTDIPVVSQPVAPVIQAPVLAAIGLTPPAADAPEQPSVNAAAAQPEIPLPEAPETPHLPKQTIHDLQFSSVIDLPLPESPEVPSAPLEPTTSGLVTIIKGPIPVMPDIAGTVPLLQPSGDLIPWSIPGIPETESFKMISPAGAKDDKLKGKSSSTRKKQ